METKATPLVVNVEQAVVDLVHRASGKEDMVTVQEVMGPAGALVYPNQYVILCSGKFRVVCRVEPDGVSLDILDRKLRAGEIRPRSSNEEQLMALDALMDDDVPVVVLTGKAGSGKTLLALAAALTKVKKGSYGSIILTKPMVQVGAQEFGILPGEVKDKYMPYLGNYLGNLEQIVGNVPDDLGELGMEIVPLQFIRGVSWAHRFVIADEIQTLTRDEILTLGTRVGEGSKLVLMGDLRQRDIDIKVKDTGLWGLTNSGHFNESGLTAAVELKKVERSKVTELFTKVFEVD